MSESIEERLAVVETRVGDHLNEWRLWVTEDRKDHAKISEDISKICITLHTARVLGTFVVWVGGGIYALVSGLPSVISIFANHIKL